MNSIFQFSSQFDPLAQQPIGGITHDIYRTNSTNNTTNREFANKISNNNATFSFHSTNIDSTTNTVIEKDPDPMLWLICYIKMIIVALDPNTGFFIDPKQGTLNLSKTSHKLITDYPNMAIDINADNVANGEVWVQTRRSWTNTKKLD